METPKGFELMLADVKTCCLRPGTFEYLSPEIPFRQAVTQEFQDTIRNYGVYIVRRHVDGHVRYIGKSGTIKNSGDFKLQKQDIPQRLTAAPRSKVSSSAWFVELCREYGGLTIEYVILTESLSPGFVESLLLQAFRNDFGKLPDKNKSL